MILASALTVVLSIVSALGLAAIVGAFATHWLARRRDEALQREARGERRYQADLEQLVRLDGLTDGLRREIRAFRMRRPTRRRDSPDRASLARDLASRFEQCRNELQTVARALNDEELVREIDWAVRLMGVACSSLRESGRRPSSAVVAPSAVDQALKAVQEQIVAVRRGKPRPPNDLRSAWYSLERERAGMPDPSSTAFLNAVSLKALAITRERRRERAAAILRKHGIR
jgi:hypothetical protein